MDLFDDLPEPGVYAFCTICVGDNKSIKMIMSSLALV